MKRLIAIAGLLAASIALPAWAESNTGAISGTIEFFTTGKPVVGAQVSIYRLPMRKDEPALLSSVSDKHGFFSNIQLEPGRYVIMTEFANMSSTCVIDDVFAGETAHVRIEVGPNYDRCYGPRVHASMVDPGATADIYRLR